MLNYMVDLMDCMASFSNVRCVSVLEKGSIRLTFYY